MARLNQPVSLARALSKLGYTSRSLAERLIREGRVSVNGVVTRNPSARCRMETARFAVDGSPVRQEGMIYLALHKPAGLVTTRSDERGRRTVYDLLGDLGQWVFPVGRLDKETSGLLLMTNDHRLGERLTNPGANVPKTYLATLDRPLGPRDAEVMRRGMRLGTERLRPAEVRPRPGAVVELTIREGKNRQIRRMLETLGYEVLALTRTGIGRMTLGSMAPGEVRRLSGAEMAKLFDTNF